MESALYKLILSTTLSSNDLYEIENGLREVKSTISMSNGTVNADPRSRLGMLFARFKSGDIISIAVINRSGVEGDLHVIENVFGKYGKLERK